MTPVTPADKLAEAIEEALPALERNLHDGQTFKVGLLRAALAAYRQSQKAQGERLPEGVTLADVKEMAEHLQCYACSPSTYHNTLIER